MSTFMRTGGSLGDGGGHLYTSVFLVHIIWARAFRGTILTLHTLHL